MLLKRFISPLLGALLLAVLAFGIVGKATPVSSSPVSPLIPWTSSQSKIALKYLAQQSGQPTSNFLIMNEYLRKFPLLERNFRAFLIWDKHAGESIHLLVDIATGKVIQDIAALEEQEAKLHLAKNGKLHPVLFDQLRESTENTEVFVGIWLRYNSEVLDNYILAELANRHPAVREAIFSGDGPFSLEDDGLVQLLQWEYQELWNAKIAELVEEMAAELRSKGMEVQVTPLLPSLEVTLSRAEIEELATRSDIEAILLAGDDEGPYAEPRIVDNLPFMSLSAAD